MPRLVGRVPLWLALHKQLPRRHLQHDYVERTHVLPLLGQLRQLHHPFLDLHLVPHGKLPLPVAVLLVLPLDRVRVLLDHVCSVLRVGRVRDLRRVGHDLHQLRLGLPLQQHVRVVLPRGHVRQHANVHVLALYLALQHVLGIGHRVHGLHLGIRVHLQHVLVQLVVLSGLVRRQFQ